MEQSRHGLVHVISQHLSGSIEKSQDGRCPADIPTRYLSNAKVQRYH
jgi:hypothetical protein